MLRQRRTGVCILRHFLPDEQWKAIWRRDIFQFANLGVQPVPHWEDISAVVEHSNLFFRQPGGFEEGFQGPCPRVAEVHRQEVHCLMAQLTRWPGAARPIGL